MTVGNLEPRSIAFTELRLVSKKMASALYWSTYSAVVIQNSSVDDTDLDALAEDSRLMELRNASRDMCRVVQASAIRATMFFNGWQGDVLVQPDIDDAGESSERINVVLVS